MKKLYLYFFAFLFSLNNAQLFSMKHSKDQEIIAEQLNSLRTPNRITNYFDLLPYDLIKEVAGYVQDKNIIPHAPIQSCYCDSCFEVRVGQRLRREELWQMWQNRALTGLKIAGGLGALCICSNLLVAFINSLPPADTTIAVTATAATTIAAPTVKAAASTITKLAVDTGTQVARQAFSATRSINPQWAYNEARRTHSLLIASGYAISFDELVRRLLSGWRPPF